MANIVFEGESFSLLPNESVLDCLLRHNKHVSNGCRSGVCQSCVMSAQTDKDLSSSQQGLSDAEKSLNYFLSCQCKPSETLSVQNISESGQTIPAKIIDKKWLNQYVLRIRISAHMSYRSGQFVTLYKPSVEGQDSVSRSYSIASNHQIHDYLEFHIKYIEGGKFSGWIANEAQVGDCINIKGPMGKCIYTVAEPEQTLLLSAIGTGLAPIYGVLQDAILNLHSGDMHCVVGAREENNFYFIDELKCLERKHNNLTVHFVSQAENNTFAVSGNVYKYTQSLLPNMRGVRVFLCGAETFVQKMRKQCFLQGASIEC